MKSEYICNFAWESESDDGHRIYASCIRKTGHEGNHVSYPSREELPQTPKKQIKEKS